MSLALKNKTLMVVSGGFLFCKICKYKRKNNLTQLEIRNFTNIRYSEYVNFYTDSRFCITQRELYITQDLTTQFK